MAITYSSPSQIRDEYLLNLKAIKPQVNTSQTDSDWWIRGAVVGSVVSGVYADQQKVASDIFPQTARRDAIIRHLDTYGIGPLRAAQPSSGNVLVTATIGTSYSIGAQFKHDPTGNLYAAQDAVVLTAATGLVPVQSIAVGQNQNLLEGSSLSMPSPPPGHGTAVSVDIAGGRNEETNAEAASRILTRIQSPISGGTRTDYQQFAIDADPSVTSASVLRFPFGPGTVAVYITAGTTDIDNAIDNNLPIVRIPSGQLVADVQDYVSSRAPLTDCATVLPVVEVLQDVTVRVRYANSLNGSAVIAGQTLTLNQLVEREVKRAIYKIPPGGRIINDIGYVLASEIEEALDFKLSALPYAQGEIAQVIADRQVDPLDAPSANRVVGVTEIVSPGTITVIEL